MLCVDHVGRKELGVDPCPSWESLGMNYTVECDHGRIKTWPGPTRAMEYPIIVRSDLMTKERKEPRLIAYHCRGISQYLQAGKYHAWTGWSPVVYHDGTSGEKFMISQLT